LPSATRVIAEAALAIGGIDEAHEAVPPAGAPHEVEAGVDELGLAQLGDVRDADALAVQEGAAATSSGEELARDGIVDDADRDLARLLTRDERRPHRNVADEVLGAVDGVDDPAAIARPALAELLAEEAVVGERALEDLHDHLLGLAIGLRDRREVGLDRHVEAAAVILERHLAGRPRRVGRRFERRHCSGARESGAGRGWPVPGAPGSVSPGNGSPRSPSTRAKTSSASTTTGMPP